MSMSEERRSLQRFCLAMHSFLLGLSHPYSMPNLGHIETLRAMFSLHADALAKSALQRMLLSQHQPGYSGRWQDSPASTAQKELHPGERNCLSCAGLLCANVEIVDRVP